MTEYDARAPVYDAWAAHMTEDVAHYVSLAREPDGPIVELMVGSSRVAIEVVRETGKPLIGIDSSPAMLEIARERSVGLPLDLRLGDVRRFELEAPAALIYVPFGLIEASGLEVEALYGGFEREPFTDESLEYVYLARKP
jgi:ubiquinone/menaquinone biosynthesis C-methylase UbiE